MVKTCIFCNLTWIVSALNKQTNYCCPKCESQLRIYRGGAKLTEKEKKKAHAEYKAMGFL